MVPQATECDPQALLAIIPPMVARLADDGSAPNVRPWAAVALVSRVSTTPGSTTAVRACGSISRILFRWRETSMTTPPMALPAMEVPAPRRTIGAPARAPS